MMATARDIIGDIALVWSPELQNADIAIDGTDIQADRGLVTSVLLSLFLDRRAEEDDVPPSGNPDDRRGWWADEFLPNEGDKIGSRLWLLDRAKRTSETAARAKEYVKEALAWMVEDRVVSSVDVDTSTTRTALEFTVRLSRPDRDQVTFKFAQKWDYTQEAA